MALHELSTNAVKYGALSVPGGQVKLSWETGPEQLSIWWVETTGPPVKPPAGNGFGTRLLSGDLFSREEGRVALDFLPGGVSGLIKMKLGGTGETAS